MKVLVDRCLVCPFYAYCPPCECGCIGGYHECGLDEGPDLNICDGFYEFGRTPKKPPDNCPLLKENVVVKVNNEKNNKANDKNVH